MRMLHLILTLLILSPPAMAFDGPTQHGDLAGPGKAGVFAVRNHQEWQAVQTATGLNVSAPDFTRDMALVILAGTRNSGGFKVEVVEVRAHEWFSEVTYSITPPPAAAPVIQMLINPYVVATVPQDGAPVAFTRGNFGQVEMPHSEFTRLTHRISALTFEHADTQRRLDYTETQMRELQDLIDRLRNTLPPGGIGPAN
ncbi:protease complex subunit PrcB family protein [Pseudomonadota bacterium]